MALTGTTVTPTNAAASSGVATSGTSFSPAAGEWVYVGFTWINAANVTGETFTVSDSHGNSYSAVVTPFTPGGFGGLYTGVFRFLYATAPGSTTVSVHASSTGTADCYISPVRFTGAATSQTGAATNTASTGSSTTTAQVSLTPTTTGSLILVVGAGNGNATFTVISGTTSVGFWSDTTQGGSAASGISTAAGTAGTAKTYGWTTGTLSFGSGTAAVEIMPVTSVTHSGAAALSGSGTLGAAGTDIRPAGASLSGSGTLGATPTVLAAGTAALSGSGDLGSAPVVTDPGAGTGALSGSGTLSGGAALTHRRPAGLTGSGTLSGVVTGTWLQFAALSGSGSLGVTVRLGLTAALSGTGSLSIPQVSGGLVNGVGGVTSPQALPGSSQVAVAPPGSGNWQWLGTLGVVTALKYSFTCPGGCDKLSMTIIAPAAYRTQLFNPGWQVKVTRGGHTVWTGKLDEPQPGAQGWNLTAVGTGSLGQNFMAYYAQGDTWPTGEPDEVLNRAIARGLPWVNPGLDSSLYASQFWYGQNVDPAGQTVPGMLNLLTTRGGLTWYVNSQPGGAYKGNDLSVFPLPTVPNRLLVCTTPVARTLGGDINYIFIRYQSQADNTTTNTAASYDYVAATNPQSIAAHGQMETFIDLSDAGVMTAAAAQAVGQRVLQIYQRASFNGPFTVSYGQLLTTGGTPVDLGTDQAATMCRLILTDFGYGGEVVTGPLNFITGAYEYDDFAQTATVTPFQTISTSLSGLLSMENTVMTPVTAAGS